MTIDISRQYPLSANVTVTVETATTMFIDLPPGAMLVGGGYFIKTAATGTTPTLTMVDNLGSPNTLLSAVAIGVANVNASIAAAEAYNYYASGARLSFTTGGTTPAGGVIYVVVNYIIIGRSNEVYGTE